MKINASRQQALKHGLFRYKGSPCKNCGTTLKLVSSYGCIKCNIKREAKRRTTREWKLYLKNYYKKNKKRILETSRKTNLRKFGITKDIYNELLKEQNYRCGNQACRRKQKRRFAVDHDHKTGEVRGLLCHGCNISLGFLDDSILVIQGLIDYLK